MQVFEFHFNPKINPGVVFDTFCYEPENIYEKRMGSLYMAGLLNNTLPQNTRFIEKLVKVIRDKYYRSTIFTPEKSLKESLKVANEFLEKITKRGDVSWLGNLSFVVISLAEFKMNFSKTGDIKILLQRAGNIIDIDEKVRLQEIDPYPLKIFNNTVSGKLTEGDAIFILTKDIYSFFKKQKLLEEFAKLDSFSEKALREILNGKEKLLANDSGFFLTIVLTKKTLTRKKELIFPKAIKKFSFKETFAPVLEFFKPEKLFSRKKTEPAKRKILTASREKKYSFSKLKFKNIFSKFFKLKKFSLPLSKIKKSIRLPKIPIPKIIIDLFDRKIKPLFSNKKIVLLFSLIFVLILGFALSKIEEEKNLKIYTKEMQKIQETFDLVNSLLVLEKTSSEAIQKANLLLQECWEKISPLSEKVSGLPENFVNQIFSLKDEISEKLSALNKLEKIENPQLIEEIDRKTFIPHNLLFFKNDIYFFSPFVEGIFHRTEKGQTSLLGTNQKIDFGTELENYISFFSKPDQIIILKDNDFIPFSVKKPYPDFNFKDLGVFNNNLYFLDNKTGQIIKYPFLTEFSWGSPQLWLNAKTPKLIGAESLTIDGSVWILNENLIYKYHAGSLQKKLDLEIFPVPEDFSKIITSPTLPYLYILEPVQKRVIVIEKTGNIIKQFQSEKFDNLLDFTVSKDGKTIYLLNGLKIYKIEY